MAPKRSAKGRKKAAKNEKTATSTSPSTSAAVESATDSTPPTVSSENRNTQSVNTETGPSITIPLGGRVAKTRKEAPNRMSARVKTVIFEFLDAEIKNSTKRGDMDVLKTGCLRQLRTAFPDDNLIYSDVDRWLKNAAFSGKLKKLQEGSTSSSPGPSTRKVGKVPNPPAQEPEAVAPIDNSSTSPSNASTRDPDAGPEADSGSSAVLVSPNMDAASEDGNNREEDNRNNEDDMEHDGDVVAPSDNLANPPPLLPQGEQEVHIEEPANAGAAFDYNELEEMIERHYQPPEDPHVVNFYRVIRANIQQMRETVDNFVAEGYGQRGLEVFQSLLAGINAYSIYFMDPQVNAYIRGAAQGPRTNQ